MYLIQFLLPLRDNAGRPFAREDFDQVRVRLVERFGGVTAFMQSPASGLWKEGGTTSHDEMVLFEVMAETLDRAWWKAWKQELEQRFRQEAVVVRALGAESI